jgi:hypothetical protein
MAVERSGVLERVWFMVQMSFQSHLQPKLELELEYGFTSNVPKN